MIHEAYCSFEVVKLLKEKEFKEPCTGINKLLCEVGEKPLLFITHQKAMRWLREEKSIIIFIMPCKDDIGNFAYYYDIAI